jgi:aspartyl-tRNA synthetase
MYRSHNNGALRIEDVSKKVTLSGWVQKTRDKVKNEVDKTVAG